VPEPPAIPGLPDYARRRTLAAIAASRGDHAAARAHVEEARRQLMSGKAGATGGGKWELDRLREVEAHLSEGDPTAARGNAAPQPMVQ
jgi:hypothetical protein